MDVTTSCCSVDGHNDETRGGFPKLISLSNPLDLHALFARLMRGRVIKVELGSYQINKEIRKGRDGKR